MTLYERLRICRACHKPGAPYGPLNVDTHDDCELRLSVMRTHELQFHRVGGWAPFFR